MITAPLVETAGPELRDDATAAASERPARISFRQPVSSSGFIDAAWWPRTTDLTKELPPLLDVLWTAARDVNRISYNIAQWDAAPRRMVVENRTVRLGGFSVSDPLTVTLTDAWGLERVDVVVIAPTTDAAVARRALLLASETGGSLRAAEILARADGPADQTTTGYIPALGRSDGEE